jgi:hypothetical protein
MAEHGVGIPLGLRHLFAGRDVPLPKDVNGSGLDWGGMAGGVGEGERERERLPYAANERSRLTPAFRARRLQTWKSRGLSMKKQRSHKERVRKTRRGSPAEE